MSSTVKGKSMYWYVIMKPSWGAEPEILGEELTSAPTVIEVARFEWAGVWTVGMCWVMVWYDVEADADIILHIRV